MAGCNRLSDAVCVELCSVLWVGILSLLQSCCTCVMICHIGIRPHGLGLCSQVSDTVTCDRPPLSAGLTIEGVGLHCCAGELAFHTHERLVSFSMQATICRWPSASNSTSSSEPSAWQAPLPATYPHPSGNKRWPRAKQQYL